MRFQAKKKERESTQLILAQYIVKSSELLHIHEKVAKGIFQRGRPECHTVGGSIHRHLRCFSGRKSWLLISISLDCLNFKSFRSSLQPSSQPLTHLRKTKPSCVSEQVPLGYMFPSSSRPLLCVCNWWCRFLFLPNAILVSSLKQLCWWNRPGHRTHPPVALKAPSTSQWTPGPRTELTKHPLRLSVNTACLLLFLFPLVGTDFSLSKKGKGTDIYKTLF